MAYNLDLLRAVREQITTHPETHDQRSWAKRAKCGTTHCIAGWACALSGDAFEWEPDAFDQREYASFISGRVVDIEDRARGLLGLTRDEAPDLFFELSNPAALELLNALIQEAESAG